MYYGARYYDSDTGRFLQYDPALMFVGDDEVFQKRYNEYTDVYLAGTQLLSGYAYADNNPLKYIDPDGENNALGVLGLAMLRVLAVYGYADTGITSFDYYITVYKYPDQFTNAERWEATKEAMFTMSTFGIGKLADRLEALALEGLVATNDTLNTFLGDNYAKISETTTWQDILQANLDIGKNVINAYGEVLSAPFRLIGEELKESWNMQYDYSQTSENFMHPDYSNSLE